MGKILQILERDFAHLIYHVVIMLPLIIPVISLNKELKAEMSENVTIA